MIQTYDEFLNSTTFADDFGLNRQELSDVNRVLIDIVLNSKYDKQRAKTMLVQLQNAYKKSDSRKKADAKANSASSNVGKALGYIGWSALNATERASLKFQEGLERKIFGEDRAQKYKEQNQKIIEKRNRNFDVSMNREHGNLRDVADYVEYAVQILGLDKL